MLLPRHLFAVFLLLPIGVNAASPHLSVQVEGTSIVIYSSMAKAGGCKASVLFSYRHGETRETRKLECNFRVPADPHHRFCEQSNALFVDLKIEGPLVGGCE